MILKLNKTHNFKHFINKTYLITIFIVFLSVVNLSECLFEDQIGKFDWKRNYVGKVKFGHFDSATSDRIIVATEKNVLASLSTKSGDILWRQVFEDGPRGIIQYLHVGSERKNVIVANSNAGSSDVITVSGYNPSIVRSWNSNTGNLINEWFLTPILPEKAEHGFWFHHSNYLYNVIPVWGSHLEITGYHPTTGQQKKTTSSKIIAAWISQENCVLAIPFYACLANDQILAVDIISEKADLVSKSLSNNVNGPIKSIKGVEATVSINEEIVHLRDEIISSKIKLGASSLFNDPDIVSDRNILLQTVEKDNTLEISASYLESGESYSSINTALQYPETLGSPEIFDIKCSTANLDSTKQTICRILLTTSDGAILLIQKGNLKWTREESLADIAAVEMIDLPLSDAEGAIENELNSKDGDVYGALIRRISGQIIHFKNIFQHILGLGPPPSATQKAGLVRDAFGLHKLIVVVTTSGKIFGIDNISGKHHWIQYLPNFTGFNAQQNLKIIIQRTSKHFPHPPQCVVVGKDSKTGYGVLYQFNPVTGLPNNVGTIHLGFSIKQFSLLHDTGADFLRGILILDSNDRAHVIPETATKYAHNFYLYAADKESGDLQGYVINAHGNLYATKTWKINLGGTSNSQKIISIAAKNIIEHVHSQGRVLGDRSVLYKYINPNLVAVATHGPDSIHKYVLNIHLIDIVSGSVVTSLSHRRIKEPLHIIHSENWLVYSYFNEKFRRTEITSIELYEGKTQTNSTVWSSLDSPPQPMVERQAYIFPSTIASIQETITEKGITNKHVLIGLTSGAIIEMPWALLDPRRPVTMPNQAREEGVIPYMPELPIPQDHIINYNQSVTNIRDIYTAPSGLESTCLVFAYGLDIFVTRVAPSKTFDLLKEDFDYFLISVVLIALTTASYVVKHLSSRKALKQAWK